MKQNLLTSLFSGLFFLPLVLLGQSPLADGTLVKIPIPQSGMYKITYDYLNSVEGLNISGANPATFQIFGNGGGRLPMIIDANYDFHSRGLLENRIEIVGGNDNSFDPGDYILMYAEGPEKVEYNETSGYLTIPDDPYADVNYYILKIGNDNGARVANQVNEPSAGYQTISFTDIIKFEEDNNNLLHNWVRAQGGGQQFFGDQFKNQRTRTYTGIFTFPNIVAGSEAYVNANMAGRTSNSGAFYNIKVGGNTFRSLNFSTVSIPGDGEKPYASNRGNTGVFNPGSENLDVTVEFPSTVSESEAWLDFIEINARRQLILTGEQMTFRDLNSIGQSTIGFTLTANASNVNVWDVTTSNEAANQQFSRNGNTLNFNVGNGTAGLRTLVVFDKDAALLNPGSEATIIENQDIRSEPTPDLIIVYHPDFEIPALELAEHRRAFSGYKVLALPVHQVYNEFSTGRKDPGAIRDMAKYFYERPEGNFKFLLLFGDGSFDPRDVYELGRDFIPVYETLESFDPVEAFPADDFYGILGGNTNGELTGTVNINVGRLPVETLEEAEAVVQKIINYDTNPETLRDWRNRITFVSDDGDERDGFTHVRPSEEISGQLDNQYPNFNVNKIYLDAFRQESTSGGQKYPEVNEAIDRALFKGQLAINYFGHGGPKGWAQERVLKIENIINWENEYALPLFITATCSFTGYDAPDFKSAGELVFLNPRGGAFAMFSTTRAVYISGNEALVKATFNRLFEKVDGKYPTIGEVFTSAKNSVSTRDRNVRKFTLIGDPSMRLALPGNKVETTLINGHDVADGFPDTLRALQNVTIEGFVADEDGMVMTDFNGFVYPTIYDKKNTVYTLGQDVSSPIEPFEIQNSILFKGKASVENGRFSFTFVMPKDINYEYGFGKISYYAEDTNDRDASGAYRNVVIGKTDPNALSDNEGPIVKVFMNSEDFEFGSITDENPEIYVQLEDDNGINVAGTSIGHDLTAVLDDNTQNTYVMNDFYEASLNDFRKGEARFPLKDLAEGLHTVKVRAWDVANNPGEGYTEFVVATSAEVALRHVLNYPNPFTDRTCFTFEHNFANQPVAVQIQIFSISGRLVKTLQTEMVPGGYILGPGECIEWDGTDDYGAPLGKGVYVYRVSIEGSGLRTRNLTGESEFRKLVILK
ncbi:MAG: type IX secretion system sortase PorU [Saprospiraceae bacterium]|nr:type IX secretion system sortase PorU [Saprospiraceae bacterium]